MIPWTGPPAGVGPPRPAPAPSGIGGCPCYIRTVSFLERLGRFIDDVLLLPDDLRAGMRDAEEALREGDVESARQLFTQILAARPTLVRAAAGLAEAEQASGDVPAARRALAMARAVEPEDPELALLDARLALAAEDYLAVGEAARQALSQLSMQPGRNSCWHCGCLRGQKPREVATTVPCASSRRHSP